MPKPGSIFLFPNFEFEDRAISKTGKYLILLNNGDGGDPLVFCITTSQMRHFSGAKNGCNSDRLFFLIPRRYSTDFRINTFVKLKPMSSYTHGEFLKKCMSEEIIDKNMTVSQKVFDEILNCIIISKDDIDSDVYDMIFK